MKRLRVKWNDYAASLMITRKRNSYHDWAVNLRVMLRAIVIDQYNYA